MTASFDVAWFGDRCVAVTGADPSEPLRRAEALAAALPDLVVRSGMSSVLVEAAVPSPSLLERVVEVLHSSHLERAAGREPRVVDVQVDYDGVDLLTAAEAIGLDAATFIACHTAQPWRVAMMGFAPGFGYLVPEGDVVADWAALSRRANPRAEVPEGSVAVAAGMSAVYPAQMPGGWQLIGRTDAVLFDVTREPPALLAPGDVVRFREGIR
jgi:KipI family sensor histidine kinase inhibitor